MNDKINLSKYIIASPMIPANSQSSIIQTKLITYSYFIINVIIQNVTIHLGFSENLYEICFSPSHYTISS